MKPESSTCPHVSIVPRVQVAAQYTAPNSPTSLHKAHEAEIDIPFLTLLKYLGNFDGLGDVFWNRFKPYNVLGEWRSPGAPDGEPGPLPFRTHRRGRQRCESRLG